MYNQPKVARPAKPRILVASNLWQSDKWTAETTNVLTPEERMRGWDTNWFSVIRIAWRFYQKRKKYDVVATVGHRLAIAYGIFHRLTPGRRPPHVVRELLLDEVGGTNWKWKLKRRLMQFLFSKTTYFIVNSSSEMSSYAEALRIPVRNFYFIPFHTNVQVPRYEPGALYGFAAGKSGRDFKTFAEAVSNLDYRFVVVATKENIRFIDFPPNVSVYCDIPYESYISLLTNASFVVVPLLKTPRSTGQVVILEAYALGKPVIASLAAGTIDYVDRDTGFLCETNDPSEMRIKMNYLIANPEVLRQMGHAALRRVLENHTFEHYANNLLNVLSRVASSADSD